MQVKQKLIESQTFETIKIGEVFRSTNTHRLFIRIERLRDTNAVGIEDGLTYSFSDEAQVILKDNAVLLVDGE